MDSNQEIQTFKTPRGEFSIQNTYETREKAREDGYGMYFTHEEWDVYTKSIGDPAKGKTHFALVPRGK